MPLRVAVARRFCFVPAHIQRFMVRIAITGGIACGKSLVAATFGEQGIPVCEADALAHAVLAPGDAVHEAVVARFGRAVLAPGGGIDRAHLGRLVFGDAAALADLNRLTHPEIMRRLRAWVDERSASCPQVAAVIPLLYEIGDEASWDLVVCVAAPEDQQLSRLRGRGLSEAEARQRVACQWPQEKKMERADFVIYNGGSVDLLRRQSEGVVRYIRGA